MSPPTPGRSYREMEQYSLPSENGLRQLSPREIDQMNSQRNYTPSFNTPTQQEAGRSIWDQLKSLRR